MIRLPPVGSLLVLAAALAGCGGAEVRAPGSAPVADATGAVAPAPPSTPPSTVTPEMVRRDSPLIFHAVVRLDQGRGAGLEPVSDEWYAPATGAYRFELVLAGAQRLVLASDGESAVSGWYRHTARVEGSPAFVKEQNVPAWNGGRVGAALLEGLASNPGGVPAAGSIQPLGTGFVIHGELPFSENGPPTPVEVSVDRAVDLSRARELGLFADTTRPDAAMRQLRPGDAPGRAHAWWLSPQFAGRSAVFASIISIDHPTPDDPASTYTVVYLDAAGRQQDDRRRSQTWPAMPDAGSGIPNSIVITTKAGDPFPCGPATTSPAVVADGTPVSVLIYDGSPGACVQDGHDTIRITAPAAELHSIIAHLARVRA